MLHSLLTCLVMICVAIALVSMAVGVVTFSRLFALSAQALGRPDAADVRGRRSALTLRAIKSMVVFAACVAASALVAVIRDASF